MGEFAIDVELRQESGKGVARKLRAAGRIPGVCYRRNAEPAAISLDPQALEALIRKATAGINTLFDLNVAGGGDFDGRQVLVKELQVDPVTRRFLFRFGLRINNTRIFLAMHQERRTPGWSRLKAP